MKVGWSAMTRTKQEPALTRGDTSAMWLFIIVSVAVVAYTLTQGIFRIIELVRNTDVTVPARFVGTTAEAPIGPDGTLVAVELDRAVLTVESLPAASVAAGVLEVITAVLATALTVFFLILLCRQLLRGSVFSARNTNIVGAAGITAIAGIALAPFFGNMVANGAFARLSDRTFDNVIIAVDLHTLIFAAFVAAFATSVFAVGNRLRRETDGLV
jgi:hypothetical protein